MAWQTQDSYNFNVADTSDIGADWDNGYTSWSNLQIVSSAVRVSSQFTSCAESYNKTISANQGIEYVIAGLVTTISSFCTQNLRYNAPTTRSGYEVIWDAPNTGSFTVEIAIRRNGTKTTLSGPTAVTFAQGDTLFSGINGNTITASVNGSEVKSYTLQPSEQDFSSGRPGMRLVVNGATDGLIIDNVVIKTWSGAFSLAMNAGSYSLSGIDATLRQGSVTILRHRK